MKSSLTIIVKVKAREGFDSALLEEQIILAKTAKKSPGCIKYELHRSNEEPGLIYFVEEWENRELWQTHMNSDYVASFQKSAAGFIDSIELHEMQCVA